MAGGKAGARVAEGIIAKAVDDRDATRSLDDRVTCGDPVDVASGEVVLREVDVELAGVLPLLLTRTHLSSYRSGRLFGPTWTSTMDQRVEVDPAGVTLLADDGRELRYPLPGTDAPALPERGPRWPLRRTADGGYAVTDPDRGLTLYFGLTGAGPGAGYPLTAVGDRNGNRVEVEHDRDGRPAAVRHSGGYHVRVTTADGLVSELVLVTADGDVPLLRFGYADDRRLVEVVNSSGAALRFDYDPVGRLTGWQDRTGRSYRYRYDDAGRCVQAAGADGYLAATLAYDPDRRVTAVTDSLGHTTRYHLDEAGRVVQEDDPLGHVTLSQWDGAGRLVARTDPLGRGTRYDYDAAGNRTAVTRPDGRGVTSVHNGLGLPTRVVDADGTVWQYSYDDRGNLTAVTDPTGATTGYGYDGRGGLTAVTDALGQLRRIRTDAAGLPVAVTDPTGATTSYQRDGFGRVTAMTDPLGGTARFGWTVEGKLAWRTLPDGSTERWGYDGEGNPVAHLDAAGQLTRTEFGPFDLPVAQDGADGRFEFRYDTELRLAAVVNPNGLVWRYDYDPAGHLVRETDFTGRVLGYTHDEAGQLVTRTNGAGQTRHYRYDLMGNVVERRSPDGVTAFDYDPLCRLVGARNPDAELSFGRDPVGRVVAETCNGRTVTSGYDPLGRRVRRATPTGSGSEWAYDAAYRPVALRAGGRTVRFGYDPAGREVARRVGDDLLLTQSFDPGHRLLAQTVTAGGLSPGAGVGRLVQQRSYRYRADGHLTAVGDRLAGPREYTVDQTGRVRAVRAGSWVERYAYDAAGNLAGADWPAESGGGDHGVGAGVREYAGTLVTRAGAVQYQYDRQGRVAVRAYRTLSGQTRAWEYGWDSDDRLVAVSTPDGQLWRYQYDPLGRRIAKQRLDRRGEVAEQVDFSWDGLVLAERSAAGRITTWDTEPDSFRPVSQRDRAPARKAGRPGQQQVDEQFYAIVTDILGTPTELIDPAGAVAWRARGTLWGASGPPGAGPAPGPVDCPLRFPGQYHDAETGLNYNYHRYYDPLVARFASADPVGLAGGPDPHGYPRNPTEWADPLGLAPCRLRQLRMDLGRAGMSVRDYDIVHVPEIHGLGGPGSYGRAGALGDGSPRLGPTGKPLIEITDLGLSTPEHAVTTIFHQMFHIRSNIGRSPHGGAGPEKALFAHLSAG